MVSVRKQENMRVYLEEKIEDEQNYAILQSNNDYVLIEQKMGLAPEQIYIALMSNKLSVAKFHELVRGNVSQGVWTAPIFYKDEQFHVPLGRKAIIKSGRSLKRYTTKDLESMVHLRVLEKEALRFSSEGILSYFQPTTTHPAAILGVRMLPVHLDYEHIKRGDAGYGFAKPTVSSDYRIAREDFCVEREIGFTRPDNMRKVLTFSPHDQFTPRTPKPPSQGSLF